MQLKYVQGVESMSSKAGHEGNVSRNKDLQCPSLEELIDLQDGEFNKLGNSFKELGFCMTELGLCLARICDKAIGGQELERSLLESCTVKGRLIHRQTIRYEKPHTNGNVAGSCVNHSNLWQQWHYDYGIFAVLIAPWFILPCHKQTKRANARFCTSCEQEHPSSSGHSYLEIFDPNKNKVQMVKTSNESFIVQMGESAGILSEGKLRANLHSVCRPAQVEDLVKRSMK